MFKEFSSVQRFPTKIFRVSYTGPVHSVCPALPVSFEQLKILFFFIPEVPVSTLCLQISSVSWTLSTVYFEPSKKYTRVLYEVTLRPVPLTLSTVRYSLVFITIDVIQNVQRERKFMEGKRDCAHCHHVISLLTVCVQ